MRSRYGRDAAKRRSRLSALLERLYRVKSSDEVRDVLDGLRRSFCLANATFAVTQAGFARTPNVRYCSTYPPKWIEVYLRRQYFLIDPVIEVGRTAFLPFEWSNLDRATAARYSFFEEASSFGIGYNGLTIPVRAPNGERSLFSVTSNLQGAQWRRQRLSSEADLLLFSSHLHDRFFDISGFRKSASPPQLSRRELQCLELLAQGLLFKQISARLVISESAVRQYVRAAKRKLGARTLSQAMSTAVTFELLSI